MTTLAVSRVYRTLAAARRERDRQGRAVPGAAFSVVPATGYPEPGFLVVLTDGVPERSAR